jgi:hypothetical protein
LKFLNDEVCALPQAVDRFMREARAAVQIQSEHVARVTDVGQLENGSPYIVMEYLEGTDLAAVCQYSSDYIDEEAEAMAARRGLWSGEFQAPWDYRRNPEPAAAQPVRREVSDPCASGGSTKTRPASRKLAVGTCSGYSSVQIALRYKPTSGSEPRRVARQPVAQVIVAHARQRSHAWTW